MGECATIGQVCCGGECYLRRTGTENLQCIEVVNAGATVFNQVYRGLDVAGSAIFFGTTDVGVELTINTYDNAGATVATLEAGIAANVVYAKYILSGRTANLGSCGSLRCVFSYLSISSSDVVLSI